MKKVFLSLLIIFVSFNLQAEVNPDNGNFHVKNTDFIVLTEGINVEFSRTYSSRSSYIRGAFGVGWSSEMESYLDIKPDHILNVEAGGGNAVRFKKVSDKKWVSDVVGNQSIAKVKAGYLLKSNTGRLFLFHANGKLHRISDTNSNYVEYVYNAEGLVSLVKDNFNNQVKLSYKKFGGFPRVTLIERNDFKARFEYSKFGSLIKATGMDGVPYAYAYDDQYNLSKITYQDGSYKEIAYNKIRDWAKRFRDIDGLVTEYDYFSDSLDPENKFGTIIKQFKEGSSDIDQARFWYEFKRKSDGQRYKYRSVSIMRIPNPDAYYLNNGKVPADTPYTVTETYFTQCCGTPLSIATWEKPAKYKFPSKSTDIAWSKSKGKTRLTKFDYYTTGKYKAMLRSKVLPNGVSLQVKYEPKHKKIAELKRGKQTVKYKYDSDGSPVVVSDLLTKKQFSISYGTKGEISVVKEESLAKKNSFRTVFFRYNGAGQAIEIKEKLSNGAAGSIQVQYSPTGRVAQVLNGSGRVIASKSEKESARRISQTFTTLVELLRPVGLSFGPEG